MPLTTEQASAVELSRSSRVLVITGGPGTGKTFTQRAIADDCDARGLSVALAAPTGKAARRLTESTGRPAKTLHRMLGYQPSQGFSGDPVPEDVVIVDEASMMDVELAAALSVALSEPHHRLVLVGDEDQLPSVGPGAVLRDAIGSGSVPVVRLTEVHRQAEGSAIIAGAHAINHGMRPKFPGGKADLKWRGEDLGFGDSTPAGEVADSLVQLVTRDLPRVRFGDRMLDPSLDVQVLCPMKRGACGVDALNERLRLALNPPGPGKPYLEVGSPGARRKLHGGDRVIQTKNDYALGVYNGETGVVADADEQLGVVVVDFGGGAIVEYTAKRAAALFHAYALTVHKSQGSEWPCVIIPVHRSHAHMWSRQLLYTGVTRAQRWCVLTGQGSALDLAIKKNKPAQRLTALGALLAG